MHRRQQPANENHAEQRERTDELGDLEAAVDDHAVVSVAATSTVSVDLICHNMT
jgi:hypothetical protein